MRKTIPIFLEKGASVIVNNASIGGREGARAGASYTASNAVIGLTRNTGFMYANEGIRCNAIAPGAVATNIAATMTNVSGFGQQRVTPGMATNPRTGLPKELAHAFLFLASADSSFINGEVLVVDGGWSAY